MGLADLKILVTGGVGFVGSAIVRALVEKHPSWTVFVLDIKTPSPPFENVRYIQTDLCDPEKTMSTVAEVRPTVIIHSAGIVPGGISRYGHENRDRILDVNVGGTKSILNAAQKCSDVEVLVYTGSCTCITDDLDHEYPNMRESLSFPKRSLVYGESKASISPAPQWSSLKPTLS